MRSDAAIFSSPPFSVSFLVDRPFPLSFSLTWEKHHQRLRLCAALAVMKEGDFGTGILQNDPRFQVSNIWHFLCWREKNCRCHFSGLLFMRFGSRQPSFPPFLLCGCDPGCLVKIDAARLFCPFIDTVHTSKQAVLLYTRTHTCELWR